MSYYKKIKPQTGEALSTPAKTGTADYREIRAAMARAHVMRAEQTTLMVKGLVAAVKTAFEAVFAPFIKAAKQRRAIGYLNGMSDHDLRDIGLSRSEIVNAVVNGPAADSVRSRKRVRPMITDPAIDASVRHAA